ncbi:tetraacyldisaccharide 4'-kinase [Deferribacter abyssi]|uniref:tetraacyldisaccharide 4'-kinase n=1 Tax=Deferribacter abyssi TaxID=213806 RepID=UPI003C135D67
MSKIISIGNISLGGTGKTPMAIFLANQLTSFGYKVCVLSRGYRGKIGYDVNLISDGKEIFLTPPLAADESYMIAINCPGCIVITGKERVKSYEYAEKNFDIDFYLLDDGFQHRKMPRDLDIVLLDHKNPISTGLPFPFGYLREFPSALKRADIIVFTKANSFTIPDKVKKYIKEKDIFYSKTKTKEVVFRNEQYPISFLKGKKVVAFSGIAKNSSFFKQLSKLGVEIVYKKGYMDHHLYREKDMDFLCKLGNRYNVDFLITTEKDYVKIPEKYKNNIVYLKIEITINDVEKFINLIFAKNKYKS